MADDVKSEMFGDRLKYAMDHFRADLNQVSLGRAVGCTKATIGQIINGQTEEPRASNAMAMARVLDVEPAWLILGEEPLRPELRRERAALSQASVHIGTLFDKIADAGYKERAYSLIVQVLEFGNTK